MSESGKVHPFQIADNYFITSVTPRQHPEVCENYANTKGTARIHLVYTHSLVKQKTSVLAHYVCLLPERNTSGGAETHTRAHNLATHALHPQREKHMLYHRVPPAAAAVPFCRHCFTITDGTTL